MFSKQTKLVLLIRDLYKTESNSIIDIEWNQSEHRYNKLLHIKEAMRCDDKYHRFEKVSPEQIGEPLCSNIC